LKSQIDIRIVKFVSKTLLPEDSFGQLFEFEKRAKKHIDTIRST